MTFSVVHYLSVDAHVELQLMTDSGTILIDKNLFHVCYMYMYIMILKYAHIIGGSCLVVAV